MATVKPKHAGASRKERAAATRARMLDAAYHLFCEAGFSATTMEAIADRADVAVQTLYFTFHTKDELLQAVHDRTVLGDDPIPPPLQPWHVAALAEPDIHRSVRGIVDGVATIFARVGPMVPVFHAVAADPAGEVWRNAEQLRLEGYERLVTAFATKAPLRRSLTRRQATDVLFVLLGPEVYRSLVIERAWTVAKWSTFTTGAITRELFALEPEQRPHVKRQEAG